MKKILRFLDEHFEEYAIALLMIAMTLVMFLQIIMRFVLNHALSWPEELSRYMFVYITFLTLGYCVKRNSMLRLDVLQEMLPRAVWNALQLLVRVVSLLLFGIMLISAFGLELSVAKTGRVSAAMGIPYTAIYFSTLLGFALAVVRSVQSMAELLHHKKKEEQQK